jgi:hypothetical protein
MLTTVTVLRTYWNVVNKQPYAGFQRIVITFCCQVEVSVTICANMLNNVIVVFKFFYNRFAKLTFNFRVN